MEAGSIGSLVKGPGTLRVENFKIDLSDRFAEGEDTVEVSDIKLCNFFGAGVSPVMGIVKKSAKSIACFCGQNCVHDFRRIPLVYDDHVGVAQFRVNQGSEMFGRIAEQIKIRERGAEIFQRLLSDRFFQQVDVRPGIFGLIASDFMAELSEFIG